MPAITAEEIASISGKETLMDMDAATVVSPGPKQVDAFGHHA